MSWKNAFLVVGLALTVAAGASAADQFSEDYVLNGDQLADFAIVISESSEPSFIEDQGYLAAIEAAAASEWAMLESSAPEMSSSVQSASTDVEVSALAGEPMDNQPSVSSDEGHDLRAFLEKREAQVQAA